MQTDSRWTARPRLAATIRAAAFLVPMAASFGAALLTQRVFDRVFPSAPWLVGAAVSLVAAMVTLLVGERIGRRFLPLAMLLKLALLFPDQVPSRLAIALRAASPRRLAKKLESADADEATAAERVLALVSALSAHDRLTRGHSERVRAVTMLIADEMGISGVERDKLEWAALLHDVGKITVSPAILNKRGAPDDAEWAELRTHPGNGAPLAGELAEWLGDTIHAIDQHHERFDGSGYPLGLAGADISRAARIVAAADAFEVMTAVRSYKTAMPVSEARAELAACQGTHFDPLVVRSVASVSLAKLHRALGPASWAMSLPFRGAIAQAVRGAGALVGGSAPSALAGLTAAVVISVATTSMADAVDGRFDAHQQNRVETAAAVFNASEGPEPQIAAAEADPVDADPVDADPVDADPVDADPVVIESTTTPSTTPTVPAADEIDTAESDSDDDSSSVDGDSRGERSGRNESGTPVAGTQAGASTPSGSDTTVLGIDLTTLTEKERVAVGDALGIDLADLTEAQIAAAQGVVAAALTGTTTLVDNTVGGTTDLVDSALDNAADLIETAINNVTTASTVDELVDNTVETVTAVTEVVETTVTDTIETVTETVDETVAAVETVVDPVVETIDPVTETVVDPVVETIDPVTETVVETIDPVVDPIVTDPVVETIDPVTDPIVTEPVVETIDPVTDPIAETVDPIVTEPVAETVDPIVTDPIAETVDPVVDPVEETIGDVTGDVTGSGGGLLGY